MNATHCAIYIAGQVNKDKLVQEIYHGRMSIPGHDLQNAKGALYSNITINDFIKEELIHEQFDVATENKVSLVTSSGGQQKKALLNYLLSTNPQYLVIDGVFDNLDIASQEQIVIKLQAISSGVKIIQILNRKKDILPFISEVFTIQNNSLVNGWNDAVKNASVHFTGSIPPPIHEYPVQPNPLVQFNTVNVSYNEVGIIKDINWQINKGEFWQLIGPNGSGKTTMLSMIYGNNPKAYGQNLILFGKRKGTGESVWEIKEKIGYFSSAITQEFDRLDTLEQMIISGFNDSIGLYIHPTDLQIQRAAAWLQLLHMYEQRKQLFRNFSMAQQRLILIARAMVKHPPLLILDEPTAGIDDESAELFTALVNKIAAESNTAILYVSHREEPGLQPKYIFELEPGTNGSTGKSYLHGQ
jgi:molybdate transport system ATP-binding protein